MNISDMATFERNNSWSGCSECSQLPKFPIQRLEPSIQKFLKVIEMDLDRLHKHRLNIEKFSRLQDWTNLNKEQINTTRTVQQIVSNIKEIEKTRRQIEDNDLIKFDERIKDMKSAALKAIKEFIEVQTQENDSSQSHDRIPDLSPDALNQETSQKDYKVTLCHPLLPDKNIHDATMIDSGIDQTQINPIPADSEAMESWENLHQNLLELNTMIHHFSTEVHAQQEKIDNIEDNIETAHDHVNEGTRNLGMFPCDSAALFNSPDPKPFKDQATKYKAAIFPIAGALIGTLVAGPVGLVAGAKIGGVAGAVGGGIAGYAGGKIVKSKQDQITNVEMSKLSEKKSNDSKTPETPTNSWLPWNWYTT